MILRLSDWEYLSNFR